MAKKADKGKAKSQRSGSTPASRHPHKNREAAEIAKAESHGLRMAILAELEGTRASPNELAERLGESLNLVAYHVRVLDKYKCVKMVDTEQRRGATEHFYESTGRVKVGGYARVLKDTETRELLAQLVDEFVDQNGFTPEQRTKLKEAGAQLAPPPATGDAETATTS